MTESLNMAALLDLPPHVLLHLLKTALQTDLAVFFSACLASKALRNAAHEVHVLQYNRGCPCSCKHT